jgi:hypothetical protein
LIWNVDRNECIAEFLFIRDFGHVHMIGKVI